MLEPIALIARDPLWLAHRYDPKHDAVHFRRTLRRDHDAATFITDEHLGGEGERMVLRRAEVMPVVPPGKLHFILHSAFCASTLLARAMDVPGASMGLKEPMVLNDIIGWRHRGGEARSVAGALGDALALLARPFGPGEAVVVKPSNVVNALAPAMLAMRPEARAVLLYAPLPVFLGSVARKGMWGRLWVRDLLGKQLRDGLIDLGFGPEDYLGLTDLQVAAVGWLAQQALFARLIERHGARVRSLDSEVLTARPHETLAAVAGLFGLALDADAVVAGVFGRDAKLGTAFAPGQRAAQVVADAGLHADELEKVAAWAEAVARNAGVDMVPGAGLLG